MVGVKTSQRLLLASFVFPPLSCASGAAVGYVPCFLYQDLDPGTPSMLDGILPCVSRKLRTSSTQEEPEPLATHATPLLGQLSSCPELLQVDDFPLAMALLASTPRAVELGK